MKELSGFCPHTTSNGRIVLENPNDSNGTVFVSASRQFDVWVSNRIYLPVPFIPSITIDLRQHDASILLGKPLPVGDLS